LFLYLQSYFGSRFFVPAKYRQNNKYNYYKETYEIINSNSLLEEVNKLFNQS